MKTRPHKDEMIRFAKSEDGTKVWYRQKIAKSWNEDKIYVLNDKYAEKNMGVLKDGI